MTRSDVTPFWDPDELAGAIISFALGILSMLVLHAFVSPATRGIDLMIGITIMNGHFIELVYFAELNRFERERSIEPTL